MHCDAQQGAKALHFCSLPPHHTAGYQGIFGPFLNNFLLPYPLEPHSVAYRGTSLIRNRLSPGPYSGPMPRALWCS